MAASNGKSDIMTGPCQNIMQAMVGGLDATALSYEPVAKGIAQVNLEAAGLANRRAQAYLEMPSRLAQCRTPQDLMAEQVRFWQTAMTQYQESTRKIVALWTQAVPDLPMVKGSKASPKPARDFIFVPQSKDETEERQRAA